MANEKIVNRENLKAFREANDTRYKNGSVVVGKSLTAKQLEPINDEVGSIQTNPFLFQGTGTNDNTTSTPTSPVAKHLELRGNSVVWNQLVGENTSSLTLTSGHKYLTKINGVESIVTGSGENISVTGGTDQVFDLTLLGKEYESALAFNRDYPKPYYEYNAGELKSCSSNKLATIECNAFDGILEQGAIDENTGINFNSVNMVRSKNYIPVIIGQTYALSVVYSGDFDGLMALYYDINKNYLTYSGIGADGLCVIPNNAIFVRLRFYKNGGLTPDELSNVMFRLYWNETHNYVPYIKHEYDLPSIELRSAGSVYDTITPNGVHTQNIDVVDLGTLDWYWQSQDSRWYSTGLQQIAKLVPDNNTKANMIAEKYEIKSLTGTGSSVDSGSGLSLSTTGTLFLYTSDSVNSPNGKLYFELATPIISEESAFAENIEVDDFGTMEFVPSDSTQEVIVPQGNKFFYPIDISAFIDDLYKRSKDGGSVADVNNFVTQSQLEGIGGGDTSIIAPAYDNTLTYAIGEVVSYNDKIYKCTTAITTPESWNSTHWTETSVASDYVNLTGAQTITGKKSFASYAIEIYAPSKPTQPITFSFDDNVSNHEARIVYLNTRMINMSSSFIKLQKNTVPYTNNSFDLGSSSLKWKDGYFAGNIYVADIRPTTGTTIAIRGDLISAGQPNNIGSSLYPFKDLYLSGNISDGTNSVSVANIKGATYQELDSSNIGSITSTQITTNWYKNVIDISGGLTNVKDLKVKMSNGYTYTPTGFSTSEIVIFSGVDFQSGNITVDTIYYKNN